MDSATAECDPGFDAPGVGYCLLGVDFDGDEQPDAHYCGIICNDTGAGICDDCNDTCPDDYLMCTEPLGGGVAEGCV